MKLVVVGSINMDYILGVDNLPKKGETLTAKNFDEAFGGKGANQAVAYAKLGGHSSIIGSVGSGSIGDELIANLKSKGVDTRAVKRSDSKSGLALITIDQRGNNTIVVSPGANLELLPEDIDRHRDLIEDADWMLIQLEIPMDTVLHALRLAKKYGTRVVMNPAPVKPLPGEVFSLVDYMTPNEIEVCKIAGVEDIEKAAKALLNKGLKGIVVTLGENGSMFIDKNNRVKVDAYSFEAVDTTAAGDSFNAALVRGLANGKEMSEILRLANISGGLATTKLGAQPSIPSIKDVEDFISHKR